MWGSPEYRSPGKSRPQGKHNMQHKCVAQMPPVFRGNQKSQYTDLTMYWLLLVLWLLLLLLLPQDLSASDHLRSISAIYIVSGVVIIAINTQKCKAFIRLSIITRESSNSTVSKMSSSNKWPVYHSIIGFLLSYGK